MKTELQKTSSILTKFASTYSVDPGKMLSTLKATCFKQKNGEVTDEQMIALLIVADQYKLNPFTREIYAYPDKQNGIVPVVGVDGWSRIINDKKNFDGMEFRQSETLVDVDGGKRCPEWIECAIYAKDRSHPVTVREYLDEVYRPPFTGKKDGKQYTVNGPWQTHTKRMLRHKAMIQCARVAYGFGGIYDQDEAERIIEAEVIREESKPNLTDSQRMYRDNQAEALVEAAEAGDDLSVREIWEALDHEKTNVFNRIPNDKKEIVKESLSRTSE